MWVASLAGTKMIDDIVIHDEAGNLLARVFADGPQGTLTDKRARQAKLITAAPDLQMACAALLDLIIASATETPRTQEEANTAIRHAVDAMKKSGRGK